MSHLPPAPPSAYAAVAAGGALGATARYGAGELWHSSPAGFPWTTLAVNTSGCLLMGALMAFLTARTTAHPLLRPFLGVGVLGGFTTFSTYGTDAHALLARGEHISAAGYLLGTLAAALLALRIGTAAARRTLR